MLDRLIALLVLVVLVGIVGSCGANSYLYRPTIQDWGDRLIDEATRPDPLAQTMYVHEEVTNRGNTAVWVAGFFILAAVLVAIGYLVYLRLNAENVDAKRKLVRAEKQQPKQIPSTPDGVPWVQTVSRPLPTDEVRYLPPPSNEGEDGSRVSWTL